MQSHRCRKPRLSGVDQHRVVALGSDRLKFKSALSFDRLSQNFVLHFLICKSIISPLLGTS